MYNIILTIYSLTSLFCERSADILEYLGPIIMALVNTSQNIKDFSMN